MTARPEFASIQLAADLMKLEEDWLRLGHRALRPNALDTRRNHELSETEFVAMFTDFTVQTRLTRQRVIDGTISFAVAVALSRAIEAAFHAVRRSLNGDLPDAT